MREDEMIEAVFNSSVAIGQIVAIVWLSVSSICFFSVPKRPPIDLITYVIGVLICVKILMNSGI